MGVRVLQGMNCTWGGCTLEGLWKVEGPDLEEWAWLCTPHQHQLTTAYESQDNWRVMQSLALAMATHPSRDRHVAQMATQFDHEEDRAKLRSLFLAWAERA